MYRSVFFSLCLLLGACTSDHVPWLYRIDVRQGNYLDAALVNRLSPGMSKQQVRFLLGTPLVNDPFHAQRWDYIYRLEPGDGDPVVDKHVVLYFENELLARVERRDLEP